MREIRRSIMLRGVSVVNSEKYLYINIFEFFFYILLLLLLLLLVMDEGDSTKYNVEVCECG